MFSEYYLVYCNTRHRTYLGSAFVPHITNTIKNKDDVPCWAKETTDKSKASYNKFFNHCRFYIEMFGSNSNRKFELEYGIF
jgi:hypothetical protein